MSIELITRNLGDSPEPPRTPGISPTPSSPRITLIAKAPVLSPSISNPGCALSEPRDLVVAFLLKSSRTFSPNVTLRLVLLPLNHVPLLVCVQMCRTSLIRLGLLSEFPGPLILPNCLQHLGQATQPLHRLAQKQLLRQPFSRLGRAQRRCQ